MTTASDITDKLATIIDSALGATESPATKARIHTIATVIGAISNELVPLLNSRCNTQALLSAIERVETGAAEIENGISDINKALQNTPQTEHNAL